MKVKIISPEKVLFEDEASLLQLPGIGGSFEILKNHSPIISALGKGRIRLITAEKEKFIQIESGVLECNNNIINILVQ